jgi:hypothetical protein
MVDPAARAPDAPHRPPFVTVVSGLPRSGTSMMMQMLAAGGLAPLTDQQRTPDADNPHGYYEFERVKLIKTDKAWVPDAVGRVVKLVHLLLLDLPAGHEYRVVFMRRKLEEVAKSQAKMLERSGKSGAALPEAVLLRTYQQQLDKVLTWARAQPHFRVLEVWYHDAVTDPATTANLVAAFLDGAVDAGRMTRAVDSGLYRNKA